MTRKEFIQLSAVASVASILPVSCVSNKQTSKFKLGYQLFSIRDFMDTQPIETLKFLKELGYQDFETYGLDTNNLGYYGYPASEFKMILEDLELTVSSGHYGFSDFFDRDQDDLLRYIDHCIEGAKTLNASYITWPWMDPKYRNPEGFRKLTPMLNTIGERVTQANLGFAYHNHGYEFENHMGENGFDIILRDTDPELVKFQMDMYWIFHEAISTPKKLVEEQPGRYVMWHIKDMDKQTRDYTELGNGSIDYTKVLPNPEKSGLDFLYIEQGGNFAINSKESAAASAVYYKENLQQLL